MSGPVEPWAKGLRSRWTLAAIAAGAVAVWVTLMWLALGGHDDRSAFADSRVPPDLAERFYPPAGWAWGLIRVGDGPVQRYGVAAPEGAPRGQVLILPDYGESAETWFETARDLTASGLTVWVLEGVGQGGSARLAGQRDLGELKSFDGDLEGARAMLTVIRPSPEQPLAVLAEGQGAALAARLVETGARPAALILSSPTCGQRRPGPSLLQALGLGGLRSPGAAGWRRDGPDDFAAGRTHDASRGAITHRWQLANPDLRMGGPSLDWLAAAEVLRASVEADLGRIAVPTLVVAPASRLDCLSPLNARVTAIPHAGVALELEQDSDRGLWWSAINAFIASTRPPIAPPLRSRAVTHLFKPDGRL